MALKHDAQGFLTGDPIDIGRALKVWDDIHENVRAIRRALTSGTHGTTARPGRADRGGNEVARPMAPAPSSPRASSQIPALLRKATTPQTGGASASAIRRDAQAVEVAGQAVAAVRAASQATQRAVAKPVSRDGRGRFVRGEDRGPSGSGGPSPGSGNSPSDPDETGALRGVTDRIASAIRESGNGMEEADPAIKAMNEVARPMARGYELLTGGNREKRQEGWLRRIWTSLTGFRKDETTFNKAANKSLKNIEEKSGSKASGGSGLLGGMFGGLGRALTRIPIVGGLLGAGSGLLKGAGRLLGFGGKEAAAASGAAKEAGLLGKAGGLLKEGGALSKMGGLLKRVPILGTLFAAGGAASDIFDTESDNSLTRREKDQRDGKAVGGAAGSVGGMLAGAKLGAMVGALGGPIGAAIGGVVGGAAGMFFGDQAGQILGETVGGWVNDLRNADIPGMIASAWEATTGAIKSGWDATTEFLRSGWSSAVDALKAAGQWVADKANTANDFIKDKTGVDIKAGAVAVKDKAVELGGKAVDATKAGAVALKDKAAQAGSDAIDWAAKNTTVGKAASKAWDGAKTAGSWVLGQTSKLFESGKGGAGTVSSGKGDFGGASYGTYQLSSSQGTLQQFLKSSKYGDQFAGLQPGTPEFNAKWKEVAKADPEFGSAQHDFIKQTHFDPQMAKLAKGGIDLSERGAAVQDAVWSTSVQFGGKSSLIEKALARKDVSKLSDAEIVSAIQDYKLANNDKLFAKSSGSVREGTAKRATDEKTKLLALAGQQESAPALAQASPPSPPRGVAAPSMPAVVASASAPFVPSAPSVPPVSEAPPITVPMASNDSSKPIQVSMPAPDVGQDVRDRGIAHIVTGGLSV